MSKPSTEMMKTMTDAINNELAVTLRTQNSSTVKTSGQQTYKVVQPIYNAVILHPSLGCPLLLDDDRKSSIELYLAAGADFFQTYHSGSNAGQGGNPVKMVIAAALKVIPWDQSGAILNHPAKAGLLYPDRATNLAKIHCHLLGELGSQLKNGQGQHFANLRQSTINQLRGQMGFTHLYRITLKDLPMVQNSGLYETFWSVRNEQPVTADFHQKYLNSSDRLLRQCFEQNYYKYGKTQKESPRYAFRVTDDGLSFEPDTSRPLLARHPIYVAPEGKKKLSIGHLSDVHISSRQYCYKGKGATVIPGADAEVSPPLGDMANNNGDNFHDLLGQMGDKADVLIITGDLHDHLHNYDPTLLKSDQTGKLWEAMYLEKKTDVTKARPDDFPFGIDALSVYSLLIHFYDTHKKPLLLTSGNHEAYEFPYGISPRVWPIGKVNEGVPLDHNLTIYEAILLYGPGYSKVLETGNFNSHHFDIFYTVFTPLTDYWQTFGDQCFVGVEWGDGEDYKVCAIRRGGTLPRATQSLQDAQKSLVIEALSHNKESILFSHFTLVNYGLGKPLEEQGDVYIGQPQLSAYDHGSSMKDRFSLYGEILNHDNLKFSLAGHSHRAGLYVFHPEYKPVVSDPYRTMYGFPDEYAEALVSGKTGGIHPEDKKAESFAAGQTRILVSASTGPIPKQNIAGEMSGQGMEFPSGSMIDENDRISLVKVDEEKRKAARPRFCVACDYIDLMKDGFWEYFKATGNGSTFEMKPHWEKIHPMFSEEAQQKLIEEVTLYLVGGSAESVSAVPEPKGRGVLGFELGEEIQEYLKDDASFNAIFLSIKFNKSSFSGLKGFDHYNFSSPWNIQVGVYSGSTDVVHDPAGDYSETARKSPYVASLIAARKAAQDRARKQPGRWEIKRHKKYGEVPSFKWRNRKLKREYACDMILKH